MGEEGDSPGWLGPEIKEGEEAFDSDPRSLLAHLSHHPLLSALDLPGSLEKGDGPSDQRSGSQRPDGQVVPALVAPRKDDLHVTDAAVAAAAQLPVGEDRERPDLNDRALAHAAGKRGSQIQWCQSIKETKAKAKKKERGAKRTHLWS